MFVDTEPSLAPNKDGHRHSPEALLKMMQESGRAKLRVYIGAAAGVGKTYQMLEDAHELKKQGVDVVLAVIETHERADTKEKLDGLDIIPPKKIEYRNAVFDEMDLDAVIRRKPTVAIVDELAHSNLDGLKNPKRYEDII